MISSESLRIRLIATVSILALVIAAIAFGIAHSIHRAATAEVRRRCSLYVVALASTSGAWLPTGGTTHEPLRYPLLALGVVYLRVVIDGEIVMDLRRPEFSTATLPQLERQPLAGTSVVRFDGHWAIDVAVPHMLPNVDDPEAEGTLRTLQFGIGASELANANQRTTKRVTLIALTTWVIGSALLIGLSILIRRIRPLDTSPSQVVGSAARRIVAGALVLLPDDLRFKVGDVSVCLTPKQASLLEMLISQPGRAFSDASILEHVWEASSYANSSDVKQQIYLIRKRLRSAGLDASAILVTVPGVGYKLVITGNDGPIDGPSTDGPHG